MSGDEGRPSIWNWPSTPLPVEGGLASSKQRGGMAESWWSQRFVDVLESFLLGGRMESGRRYARKGQIVRLDVQPGHITAQVQGTQEEPYVVILEFREPTADQWTAIEAAMAAKVGFAARLLAGEVPPDLEAVFADAGVPLFPTAWRDLRSRCSCPDSANPCKHIAAVLYLFADQLDTDPWLLLRWRGRERDDLMATMRAAGGRGSLRAAATSAAGHASADEIAPWWPFPPGPLPDLDHHAGATAASAPLVDPERPDAVLDQLEELDAVVAGAPVRGLLRPAYDRLAESSVDGLPPHFD